MQVYNAKVALLGSIIDYAGTFPPAALSLDRALQRAASFRREGIHPWLMAKVALPFSEIKKLTPKTLYDSGSDGSPWVYTALGTPLKSDGVSEVEQEIEWELRELRRFSDRVAVQSLRQVIVAYESKLPAKLFEGDSLEQLMPRLLDRITYLTGNALDPYFEVEPQLLPTGQYRLLTEALADWAASQDEKNFTPGVKLRFAPDALPEPLVLAEVISEVLRCRLRFKATQGLHAALTHGKNYGFVNLFAALTLAQAYGPGEFGPKEIAACLVEENKTAFRFENLGFSWNGFELDAENIEAAKRRHGATFGSCSLDEPDQDLKKEFA